MTIRPVPAAVVDGNPVALPQQAIDDQGRFATQPCLLCPPAGRASLKWAYIG